MTAWRDVERLEPEFAQRVQGLFDAHRHKTIATLRADGAPRISGIETGFRDGELTFGSMPNARKGDDLRRDPRFAMHSAPVLLTIQAITALAPKGASDIGRMKIPEPIIVPTTRAPVIQLPIWRSPLSLMAASPGEPAPRRVKWP